MKGLQVVAVIGGVAFAGLGLSMALTNPSPADYEDYAVGKLSLYLKEKVCSEVPKVLNNDFLQNQCISLVDVSNPRIHQIINQSTERQNFLFFSIYKTDLSVNSLLPSYHFETVAAFQTFYVYQAQKQ